MIGLPASGKSTFIQKLCKKNPRTIVVSSDEIRFKILDFPNSGISFDPAIETTVWKEVEKRVEEALEDPNCDDCILDACNLSRRSRQEYLKMAKQNNARTRAFFLNGDPILFQERNQKRNRHVPEEVLNRMIENLEPPTKEEFDEIQTIWVQ
jgi:predicted kinase